jgi:hypothetical protein
MYPTADHASSIRFATAPVTSRALVAGDQICGDVGLQRQCRPGAVG